MRNPALIAGVAAIVSLAAVTVLVWPVAPQSQGAPADSTAAAAPAVPGIPDFSGFWTRSGDNPSTFDPAPDGPSAITTAFAHHGHCVTPNSAVGACADKAGDAASNAWVADTSNPILQPWTRAALKKNADNEAKGISHMTSEENCKSSGVPEILNLRYTVQVLQSPSQVTILYENNQQVRRAYVNAEHPAGLSPSWYGHSVAHYEGDTLVIDTVAQNPTTDLDRFGTLHSEQLRVVERYRMLGRDKMQVVFTVDDPKAFTTPWRGVATYKRAGDFFPEFVCAENNRPTNLTQFFDVPTAKKADF